MPTKWNALTAASTVATNDYFVGYNGTAAPASGAERRWLGSDLGLAFARTLGNNLDGTDSVGFGNDAGLANITGGDNNVFFGDSAGVANTTGSANVFVGQLAGGSNTIGARNIFIGQRAGQYQTNGVTALTDPEKSIYIGYLTEGSSNSAQEEIAIGYNAEAKGSNTAAIGNTSQTTAYIYGNVITSAGYTGLESNFVGRLAGNTSAADYAVGVGHQAHYQTTASADRAVGVGAYAQYQSGSYGGVAAGYRAGDSSNGDYSIYIGYEAGLNDLFDNVICIGKGVTATADNTTHIGNASNVGNYFYGTVYIGGQAALNTGGSILTLGEGGHTHADIYGVLVPNRDNVVTNGGVLMQGFWSTDWTLPMIGANASGGGLVLGYGVRPKAGSANNFTSGHGATLARGAYIMEGSSHTWYNAASQAVGEGLDISMNKLALLTGTNALLDLYNSAGNTKVRLHTNGDSYFTGGNVGVGTTSPNANAILDVSSTTKAFMPPRMTTTQKNAISSPTAGMVVYDSTLSKLAVYTGSAWETVTSA